MGVIWTSKTRTSQPQSFVGVTPLARRARLLVANGDRIPRVAANGISTFSSLSGTTVGKDGVGYLVNSVSAGQLIPVNGSGVDSSVPIASGESWTFLVHIYITSFVSTNPGFWRTGGNTFAITNGASSNRPWLRLDGVDVLKPTSGDAFAAGYSGVIGYRMQSAVSASCAWDGVIKHHATHSTAQPADTVAIFGSQSITESIYGTYYSITWLPFAVTDDEFRKLTTVAGYYDSLFVREKRPLFFTASAGSNNTGTLAVTLDAATLTGVGGAARSGTLATTLDAATLTGVGNVTRSGTLAVTLDAATLAGTGAVTTSGILAVTLDDATLAGVGSVAVGTNRDGALAVTLDSATLAGVGAVTRSGTLAVTLDAVTLAGVGAAGQAITGTLGVTLGNVTLAGIGAIPATPSAGGGKTFGSNKKKKKQRKAIESEEWLKAEETAKQLLQDRFTKTTPEAKLEALASHIESLQPVIDALKALATEGVQEPVQETRTEELTEHQQVLTKFDALITKMASIEELLIIMMAQ